MLKVRITQGANNSCDVKLSSGDRDVFMEALEALKGYVSDDHRVYDPSRRVWHIDRWGVHELRNWISYCRCEHGAEADWQGDRYEDPEAERTPPKSARPTPVDPYQALHLLPSAPPEVV
ncbi:MAG: hypothetical protein M3R15_32290, partial [Acidobacteriota bacterium]|nr:hypothetical protein [Acidobacteriota bacterium]